MKPLPPEEIIFINDEECNSRKGVTISKIKTANGEEIRVAIWNILPVEGGFVTPKSSGISLKVNEYEELINKTEEIKTKIQDLSVSFLDDVLSTFNPEDAIHFLKDKVSELEKKTKKNIPSTSSSNDSILLPKKKRKSDSL
jgi:hypothetical protein